LYILYDAQFLIAERIQTYAWLNVRSKLVRFTAKDEDAARQAISRLRKTLGVGFIFDFQRLFMLVLVHILPQYRHIWSAYACTCIAIDIMVSCVGIFQGGRAIERILLNDIDSLPEIAKKERERGLMSIRGAINEMKPIAVISPTSWILIGWWPFARIHLSWVQFLLLAMPAAIITHLKTMQPPHHVTATATAFPEPDHDTPRHPLPIEQKSQQALSSPTDLEVEKKDDLSEGRGSADGHLYKMVSTVELEKSPNLSGPRGDGDDMLDSSTAPLQTSSSNPDLSSSQPSLPLFNPFREG